MIQVNTSLWRSSFFSFWKQPKLNRLGSNLLWGLIKQLKIALKNTNQALIDYSLRGRFLHILTLDTQKRDKLKIKKKLKNKNKFCFQNVNKKTVTSIDTVLQKINLAVSNKNRKYFICNNFISELSYYKILINLIFLSMVWNTLKKAYYWLKANMWLTFTIDQQLLKETYQLTTHFSKQGQNNNFDQHYSKNDQKKNLPY